MKKSISIGYVTAMWGRHWLTGRIFRHVDILRGRVAPEIELVPVAAGSEGDVSRGIAEEHGFLYVEAPNSPLGAKWNAALGLLRDLPVAGACIFGSDDICNEAYLRRLADFVEAGHELVGMSGLYFFEHDSRRLYFWKGYPGSRENDSAGAGRFIGRRVLDSLDWRLWPDRRDSGLDSAMLDALERGGGRFRLMPCRDGGAVVADIKGHGGMNSFEIIAACGESMLVGNPRGFFRRNFEGGIVADLFPDGVEDCADSDAWLWREWINESPDADGPHVWCAESDRFLAPAMDFMTACRQAGFNARWIGIDEYPDAAVNPGRDLFYGRLGGGETVLAELLRPCGRQVLDDRDGERPTPAAVIDRLPFPCIRQEGQGAMPPPFSAPPDYPAWGQRAHIVCCVDSPSLRAVLARAWAKPDFAAPMSGQKVFFTDFDELATLDGNSACALPSSWIFPLRSFFRLVIFSQASYAARAAYFLAGGTPGICLGQWPRRQCPDGIVATGSLPALPNMAVKIVSDRRLWDNMAAGVRKFANARSVAFRLALKKYMGCPGGG